MLPLLRLELLAALALAIVPLAATAQGVVYQGADGPGKGKHVVLVSGDEEYRSEETLPQLGKILAKHHGFKCTALFAIDPKDGTINPNASNIPGLEALKDADLLVIFTRFRNLPDDQMKHLADYIESGKPIIGMRTATHAFNNPKSEMFAKYHWQGNLKGYEQGFGRQVLGETWISHHGNHGSQSTRGIVAEDAKNHPILRGIKDGDIWGPTDVYGVRLPLPGDSKTLVLGQVLKGMKANDAPVAGKQNEPMMPIAWTRTYHSASGKDARVFATTMGASQDFESVGLRRLLVNAVYWCVGLEKQIAADANVSIVGEFHARPFGNNRFDKGVRPADLEMK
jgi:type 1 glutamine amidotransferase